MVYLEKNILSEIELLNAHNMGGAFYSGLLFFTFAYFLLLARYVPNVAKRSI